MSSRKVNSEPAWGRWVAWSAAGLVTVAIVVLHVVNLRSAGGLWRDEAAAVQLATMPSLGAVWSHLEHESFPLGITMLIRGWNAIGLGGSDLGLRALGLAIGLLVVAALWWNAWRFSSAPPLLSLLLLGLSATAIRWGDSLRAYGLGVLFLLLTLGMVGRVVSSPSRRNVLLAMAAGVLAVQTLYQNSFLLAAFCLSGALVAALRREPKRALLILAIGLPAALSLLPYLGVIRRANEWNVATQLPIGFPRIWTVLSRALSESAPWALWLWGVAIALAIVAGLWTIWRCGREKEGALAAFLLCVMLSTSGGYYLFLKLAKFPTEVWYYLPWMAVIAVATDCLIAQATRSARLRAIAALLTLAGAGLLYASVQERVQVRMTNLDLVAQHLSQRAAPGDLVLVHPWFCGATFHRYYQGRAPWQTIPPSAHDGLQRLDLFKAQLQKEDPIQPVLEEAETVLRSGGTIWLVGYFLFLDPPQPPAPLPRPGEGPEGWRGEPYMLAYGMQTTYFLQKNATQGAPVEIPVERKVNPFENLEVHTVSGWLDPFGSNLP